MQAYRWAHWEAGLIGHVLYLEAQALGLGATGMGCFVDFKALRHFELMDSPPSATKKKGKKTKKGGKKNQEDNETKKREQAWKDIYHFTIGVEAPDERYQPYRYEDNMLSYAPRPDDK